MTISPELLEILACPACKSEVKLTPNSESLKCVSCHRVYPIRNDIPVMLIDEATIEPPEKG
ncbi:MAG: Trm112 family protein [Acidobacteriota bacterium]